MEQDSLMLPVLVADAGGESVSLDAPPPSLTVYDADSVVIDDVDMTEEMPLLGEGQLTELSR